MPVPFSPRFLNILNFIQKGDRHLLQFFLYGDIIQRVGLQGVEAVKGKLKYNLLLMLAALIWGGAFVAQSVGMDYTGPYTFNVMRSFLGSLVLLPVIFFLDKKKSEEEK